MIGRGNGKVGGPCKLQAGAAIGNNPKHYCHSSFSSRFGFGCHIPSTVCSFFSSLLTFSFNHNRNSFNHYDSDRLQMFDFCAFIDCIPLPASFENLHAAYFIRLRIGNWECEEQWSCASFRAKENCFWSMWMDERTYCAVLSLSIQWSMDLFNCWRSLKSSQILDQNFGFWRNFSKINFLYSLIFGCFEAENFSVIFVVLNRVCNSFPFISSSSIHSHFHTSLFPPTPTASYYFTAEELSILWVAFLIRNLYSPKFLSINLNIVVRIYLRQWLRLHIEEMRS